MSLACHAQKCLSQSRAIHLGSTSNIGNSTSDPPSPCLLVPKFAFTFTSCSPVFPFLWYFCVEGFAKGYTNTNKSSSCRVDFDCQRDATQEQVPLVAACKAAFDNALPSKWAMLAMLAPGPFLPFVKLLSRLLPTRTDAVVTKAVRFLYDTSACLIEASMCTCTPNASHCYLVHDCMDTWFFHAR